MRKFGDLELSIDEAAELLLVRPQTIQRRLKHHELLQGATQGRAGVLFEPQRTWLRVDDAGALLDLASSSVRAAIRRGELDARRERSGRYRVRLQSILRHPHCTPEVLELFLGHPPPAPPAPPTKTRRLRRDVHVLLDPDELQLLERTRDLYGSIRAAVVAGLRAVDFEGPTPDETADLRAARDRYREDAQHAQQVAHALQRQLQERPVEQLACLRCGKLVPIDEADFIDLGEGTHAIVHAAHAHRRNRHHARGALMAIASSPRRTP